jgi:hypothetical protein
MVSWPGEIFFQEGRLRSSLFIILSQTASGSYLMKIQFQEHIPHHKVAWHEVDAYFKSPLGFKVTLWCFLCPRAELTESHDSFVRQSADIFGPVRWPYAAEKISGATETINFPGSAACEKPSYRPQSVAFRHAMESVNFRTVSLEVDDGRCTVYGVR